jgi:hypothetical protein
VKRELLELRSQLEKLYRWYVPPFRINRIKINPNIFFLPDKPTWYRLDGEYYSCTLADFRKIIEWDWTDTKKYVSETFDCDKFSMYFKSRVALDFGVNAVAVILDYSSGHSYNVLFPVDDVPKIFEPQTDEIIEIKNRDKRFYAMVNYVVLL